MSVRMETESLGQQQQVDLITGLVISSFRFSRGSYPVQNLIFMHAAQQYKNSFNDDAFIVATGRTVDACKKIVKRPDIHPQRDLEDSTIKSEVESAMSTLKRMSNSNVITLSRHEVAETLLENDATWMRPPRRQAESTEPYTSNLIKYGILGQGTGLKVYDDMFQSAANALPEVVTAAEGASLNNRQILNLRRFHEVALGHIAMQPDTEERINAFIADNGIAELQSPLV